MDKLGTSDVNKKSSEKSRLRAQIKDEEQKAYNAVRKAQLIDNPLADFPAFQVYKRNGIEAILTYSNVNDLDTSTLEWILKLEKKNMESVYNSCSWGWNDKKKKKEMTEPEARYLVAKINDEPVAFSHFRFDMDYGDEVLYCYELQVDESVKRKGLGKFLLQVLELMAFKNNMKKVILTVLKHNKPAVDFFYSLKYARDETNPIENLYEEIPYEILSKYNKKLLTVVES